MKKLLILLAASSALTMTACTVQEIATKVTDADTSMKIGGANYSKQEIYELLKLSQGKEVVTNWFREAIYLDLDSNATSKIQARISVLWDEFNDSIWWPSTLESTLATKKYYCETSACAADDKAVIAYKNDVLKPSAIDELFTEYYLQTNAKVEENYFKDYQPRNVWALQKDVLSNIQGTVSRIKGATNPNTPKEQFAREAVYFHHSKSIIDPRQGYYNNDKKFLGNKLESYGKKGILNQSENWRGTSVAQVTGADWVSSGRYLKTGNIGVVLNTSSALPSSINKHLFNEGLAIGTENDPIADAYAGAWIDTHGLLTFKDTDGKASRFFTETGDTHYVVMPKVIKFNDSDADRAEARRQIAKVSAVKTKAQNQLFKKYEIEAWDQVIWDAIDATILGNKEDK